MTPAAIRVGQINALIRVTVQENGQPMDISTATVTLLKLKKPNGELMERAATFRTDGVDGVIEYRSVLPTDIDIAGPWIGQPYIEMGADEFHASMFSFQVGEVLM
jgi:BppU N-terminal domain